MIEHRRTHRDRGTGPRALPARRPHARPVGTRIVSGERGATALVSAVALVALIGFIALGLDVGHAFVEQSRLQTATDAAALATAGLIGSASPREITARAQQYAARNLSDDPDNPNPPLHEAQLSVDQGRWDPEQRAFTVTSDGPNAVRVIARRSEVAGRPVRTWFATLFGRDHFELSTQAIAVRRRTVCLLALEPTAVRAVELSGGSELNMPDCGVQINSSGNPALRGSGGASITASSICIVGTCNVNGTLSPAPQPSCAPMADPLAALPAPVYGACDYRDLAVSGQSRTLSPAAYCGGIRINGGATVTFEPGIYVIKDGPLNAEGGGSIVGDGVTLLLGGRRRGDRPRRRR